jgi:hypothetical protein
LLVVLISLWFLDCFVASDLQRWIEKVVMGDGKRVLFCGALKFIELMFFLIWFLSFL